MSNMIDLRPKNGGPSAAAALDIFAGNWAYEVPIENTKSGTMQTFKIKPTVLKMAMDNFPDFKTFDVLELGPHEGEQSYHLSQAGVQSVYAIEGRPANFLKCLIVKNELKLHNVKFAVGDFVDYLERNDRVWDLVYCTGVLYHMKDPARLIELIAKRSKRLAMSTVVFDLANMQEADRLTDNDQFPTRWLQSIDPVDYEHQSESGLYNYYRRSFIDSNYNTVMGHGNSHALEANLLASGSLLSLLQRCGGNILYWKAERGPRGPMAYAAVEFS